MVKALDFQPLTLKFEPRYTSVKETKDVISLATTLEELQIMVFLDT